MSNDDTVKNINLLLLWVVKHKKGYFITSFEANYDFKKSSIFAFINEKN